MANLGANTTYETIWDLAVYMAGREAENVPAKESVLLQSVFAAELKDLWNKEAWDTLSDNWLSVTISDGYFNNPYPDSDGTTLGDVLGVYTSDPRTTSGWRRLEADRVKAGSGKVYVLADADDGAAFVVEYQLPVPDLLDSALTGTTNEDALMATAIPEIFRLPLAYRGAAHLLAAEDPGMARTYAQMADLETARLAARVMKPWWRQETVKR